MPTQQERFEAVLARLREQEITPTLVTDWRSGIRSECLAAYVQAAEEAGTHLWAGASHEGARWLNRVWPDRHGTRVRDTRLGTFRRGDSEPQEVRHLWFSYPHLLPETAADIATAFRAQGFSVTWDGDPHDSVLVRLF